MTRDELISRTRQLVAEGERLLAEPSLGALQLWLQLSDDLLASAWGSMDRYHLAWLMVGKPKGIIRGRPMTRDEEHLLKVTAPAADPLPWPGTWDEPHRRSRPSSRGSSQRLNRTRRDAPDRIADEANSFSGHLSAVDVESSDKEGKVYEVVIIRSSERVRRRSRHSGRDLPGGSRMNCDYRGKVGALPFRIHEQVRSVKEPEVRFRPGNGVVE